MGFYADRIVPRLVDRTCAAAVAEPLRRRVCAGLHGRVIEIGFGSGLNMASYPHAVDRVVAVEPSDLAWELAGRRLSRSRVPVDRGARDAQDLPFGDATFDTALSTWTMCTIPDIAAALRELRRVLVPGGTLHFVEHGLAPDPRVQRWQRRFEPVQHALAGGCHLTRDIRALLRDAGFDTPDPESFYLRATPKILGATTLGVATRPGR